MRKLCRGFSGLAALSLFLCLILPAQGQSSAPAPTSVSLAVTSATLPAGQTVATLTASVTSGSTPVTVGEVDFLDGTKPLGKVQVVSSNAAGKTPGTATLPRLLGPGPHSLSAIFRGTLALASSTSSVIPVSVTGVQGNSRDLFIAGNYALPDVATSLTIADVNGDGLPDVITPLLDGGKILIFLNDPTNPGQLLSPTVLQGPLNVVLTDVAVADLDGDGLPDITVSVQEEGMLDGHSYSTAWCFYQNPAAPGTFLPVAFFSTGITVPGQLFIQDMDGDGLPDAIFTGNYQTDSGEIGHSAGIIFHPATGYPLEPSVLANWTAEYTSNAEAIADFDGDGLPDIAFDTIADQTAPSTIDVFQSNPSHPGEFTASGSTTDLAATPAYKIAAFDLDQDGHPDLMIGATSSGLLWLRNNPASPGTFLPPVTFPVFGYAEGLGFGSISSSGANDVVVGSNQTAFSVLYGTGPGTLDSPKVYSPTAAGGGVNDVAVADMDGDGLDDVVSLSGLYTYVTAPTFQLNVSTHVNPGTKQPPVVVLQTPNGNTAHRGQPFTFTAVLTSSLGSPSGFVNFLVKGISIGAGTIGQDGTATLVNSTLPAGTSIVTAQYEGDADFGVANSNPVPVAVEGLSSSVYLTAAPATGTTITPFTLTATVTGSPGQPTPTGTLRFENTLGVTLADVTLDASGSAHYPVGALPQGTQTFHAAYLGDTTYAVAYTSITITVAAGPSLTLAASATSVTAGTPVTLTAVLGNIDSPGAQTVAFLDNSGVVHTGTTDPGGTVTWVNAVLPAGVNQMAAQYSQAGIAVTSSVVPIDVIGTTTVIGLTTSPAAPVAGEAITVTAAVKPSFGSGIPTGSVSFTLDGAALGKAAVGQTGEAALALSPQAVGTHTLIASYSGDQTYDASVATLTLTFSTVPADFTLSLSQSAISFTSGGSASVNLSLAAAGGFSDNLTFSCTGLPVGTSCSFAPPSLVLGGVSQQSILTVSSASSSASVRNQGDPSRLLAATLSCLALPCLFCFPKRRFRALGALVSSAALLTALNGCGSNGNSSQSPTPTTFALQVVAKGQQTTTTHGASLTVTVQ